MINEKSEFREGMNEQKIRLLSEIEQTCRRDKKCQDINFRIAQLERVVVVAASAATVIEILIGSPRYVLAALGAIPGFTMFVDRIFLFYKRSQWHGMERLKLQELLHKLLFQNATVKEVSEAFCRIRQELEPLYPGFGSFRFRIGERS